MRNPVYLAAVTKRLPRLYKPEEAIDILFPVSAAEGRVNRLAKKAAKGIGIQNRPTVLDEAKYPVKAVAKEEYIPANWCTSMVKEFGDTVNTADIGFLSVSYNISSDPNVLPSVAARVAGASQLNLDKPAEEKAFYGCAGSLYSLESAVNYCGSAQKAAAVCTFDQCSWIVNPVTDMTRPDFKDHLRTSLLFSDGAAGMLLIPEHMKRSIKRPVMKILDIECAFTPGNSVRMEGGHLILADDLKDEMPQMITKRLIRPMLERNGLNPSLIDEWSLHQGGLPILMNFGEPETLALTPAQMQRSIELFQRYGNFSAPSCLFVLDSFFNEESAGKNGKKGMMVSFGAGYYLGAMLYEWDMNV